MRIADLLKGWDFAPRIVGIVRGAIEAAVLAGIGYVIVTVSSTDWGEYAFVAPFVLFGLRWLEAEADQIIDPQQNRTAEARAANPPQ